MNSISSTNKITALVLLIILFGTFSFSNHTYAQTVDYADFGFDTGSFIENTLQEVTGFEGFIKEIGLDKIAFVVAQTMAQKITSSITNSLTGGASGDEPMQFIKDFGKHFEKIGFEEGQKYVETLFSDTKNPYSSQIGSNLVSSFSSGNKSQLDKFSLGTVLGVSGTDMSSPELQQKLQDFGNDATVGGYSGLFALGLPENTPAGSSIIANEELTNKITAATEAAKTELTSSGYTGKKTYTDRIPTAPPSEGETPPTEIPNVETPKDSTIESPAGLSQKSGDIAISESTDRLKNVDELGELVSSTITQLASSLISKGLSKVGSVDLATQKGTTYGGANDIRNYFENQQGGSNKSFPSIIVDFGKELAPAMDATEREIKVLQETLEIFKSSPQVAHNLDTCTPGPDRGWENRLNKYYTKQTQGVVEKVAKDEDATDEDKALQYLESRMSNAIQEERGLVTDPLANLPGAGEANLILGAYEKKAVKFQQIFNQLVTKRSSFNSLRSIIVAAKSQRSDLTLSFEDWGKLDKDARLSLYREATVVFPDSNSNDIINATGLTRGQAENMMETVLAHQWSEWEEFMDENDDRKEIKRTLFLRFNEMRAEMSSNISLARSQSFLEEIKEDRKDMEKILGQCLLLRRIFGILPVNPGTMFVEAPPSYVPSVELTAYELNAQGTYPQIKVRNMAFAKDMARGFRDGTYAPPIAELQKRDFANQFPDYKTLIFNILLKPSILDNGDVDANPPPLTFIANTYGDELAVRTPQNMKQIFQQDAEGELFCRIPKSFGTTPGLFANGGRTFLDMQHLTTTGTFIDLPWPLGVLNIPLQGGGPKIFQSDGTIQIFQGFGGGDDTVKGNKPILCSSPKIFDSIVANIESSGDPISNNMLEWRNKLLKNPHTWYFSNGLESYIFFDKTAAGI